MAHLSSAIRVGSRVPSTSSHLAAWFISRQLSDDAAFVEGNVEANCSTEYSAQPTALARLASGSSSIWPRGRYVLGLTKSERIPLPGRFAGGRRGAPPRAIDVGSGRPPLATWKSTTALPAGWHKRNGRYVMKVHD